jgi:hypothetical protein
VVAASLPAALARQRPWGPNRVGEAVDVAVLAWLDERRKEHFAALTTWAQWFLQRPRTSPVELPPSGGGRGRRTQQSVQEVPEVVRRPVARGDVGRLEGTPVQLPAHALHLLGDAGGCVRHGAHRRGDGASAHRGGLSLWHPQGAG